MAEEEIILNRIDLIKDIDHLGYEIYKNFRETRSKVAFVGIREGGVDITNKMRTGYSQDKMHNPHVYFLDPTTYRVKGDPKSMSPPKSAIMSDPKFNSLDYDVIVLIDDVIETGDTIHAAMNALDDYGRPNQVQLATFLDITDARVLSFIQPDYSAMNVSKNILNKGGVEMRFDLDVERGLYLVPR